MFRKYGVSGICVFNLSRMAKPGDIISIDFLDMSDRERAHDYLRDRRTELLARFGSVSCADLLRGLVLPRVSDALLKRVGLSEDRPCDDKALDEIASILSSCTFTVAGIGDADICQVRRGGFAVEQFDSTTMQALDIPGLFAVGEALDVDGPCGGYNLHWAWTSGMLAGRAAAQALVSAVSASRGKE